jgi:hypothetical protein
VLALAYRPWPTSDRSDVRPEDEQALTFIGLVGMQVNPGRSLLGHCLAEARHSCCMSLPAKLTRVLSLPARLPAGPSAP